MFAGPRANRLSQLPEDEAVDVVLADTVQAAYASGLRAASKVLRAS